MKKLILGFVLAMILIWTGAAISATHLNATYAFTGENDSLVSSGGFNSAYQALAGSVYSHTDSVYGTVTFKTNGAGTVESNVLTTGPSNAGTSTITYEFTYTITGDGTITMEVIPGSFTQTFTGGPIAGQTSSLISGSFTFTGKYLANENVMILTTPITLPLVIEEYTTSAGVTTYNIFHRSHVLIKQR